MEERRIMAVRDGRRLPPRNSRGEFRRRRSRRDRGMDYAGEDMRMRDYGDVTRRGRYGDYGEDMGDYGEDMARGMRGGRGRGRSDYGDYEMDGHYPQGQGGSTYYPIQAMGTFEGYYGMPEQSDYGMNYRRYGGGYDMRGRGRGRDYGYDYGDYGDDYGDYGETLSEKELNEWCEKMKKNFSEQEKQMFSEQAILQKAKQMGIKMDGFTEKELYVDTVRNYTDHKKSIGANPDLALKMAYDDFHDEDGEYNGKGSMWLAVYYDNFVKVDD
jgi:hypothetical protein